MIRVLELQSGDGDICSDILHVSLGDDSEYEALSYIWGEKRGTKLAYCNNAKVLVAESLSLTLKRFRREPRRRRLWVDAMCINQDDNEDRVQQVRMMGQIYKHAQCVIVWLGEADQLEDTEATFAHACSLTKDSKTIRPNMCRMGERQLHLSTKYGRHLICCFRGYGFLESG